MKSYIRKVLNNSIKKYYTQKAKKTVKSFKEPLRVNNASYFNLRTTLGENTNFNGMAIHGTGEVIIGDNFHSGQQCMMFTSNHNYEGDAIPYDKTFITKNIVIEDNVWLGTRVIIMGGVTIGEGAIIQAGSVVVSDIPEYSIAGGSPAKVFSQRDIEHYEKLKQEGKFH